MTATAGCDTIQERGLIERYVAGRATDAEAAELERHFLTCAACQADVRLAAAIRSTPVDGRATRYPIIGAVALAAAAVAAGILVIRPFSSPARAALGRIGAAPMYLGIPVRSAPSAGDSAFAAAMDDYQAARYDRAARGLEATLHAGLDSAPAAFFRAASLLMLHRDAAAATAFADVIALGATPYLPEAHYYRAKALIRQGRVSDAVRELRQVGGDDPDLRRTAAALADSLTGPTAR